MPLPRTVLVAISLLAASAGAVFAGCNQPQAGPSAGIDRNASVELRTTVETSYYDIAGDSSATILESARMSGPVDTEGNRAVGLATQKALLTTQTRSDGDLCWLSAATVTADLDMLLPRHIAPDTLDPAVAAGLERWSGSIATHEQRHVDIYVAGAGRAKAALDAVEPQPSCEAVAANVESAWEAAMARTEAEQESFHIEDRMRETVAREPLVAQVEANRARLDELEAQIASDDAELGRLRAEIDGTSSPSRHNALVDEHTGIVAVRNARVEELNALSAETNVLIEQLNWTT